MNYIPLYYYLSNNFGDAMSHYIAGKISGKQPLLVDRNDECLKYMVTGSILNNDIKNAIVWGCGVAFSNDIIHEKTKIVAVRGRLTGELCRNQEIPFDEVYGDPALLMPRFYNPMLKRKGVHKKFKLGIIPHYVDAKIVMDSLGVSDEVLKLMGIKLINVLDDVESVVDQIFDCEKTISSSLHGIITSHTYGIPCSWTKFSDSIGGDDFKFLDYFSTTDIENKGFLDLREGLSLNKITDIADNLKIKKVTITENLDLLFNACPFKK